MSPTSYQAAPPRTTTIADERASVKLGQTPGKLVRCFRQPVRQEETTTRCTVSARRAKLALNLSVRQPYRCSFAPGLARRYRIAAPSPLPASLDQSGRNANIRPAQGRREIAAPPACR